MTWKLDVLEVASMMASWSIKVSIATQKFATSEGHVLWSVRVVIQTESLGWHDGYLVDSVLVYPANKNDWTEGFQEANTEGTTHKSITKQEIAN